MITAITNLMQWVVIHNKGLIDNPAKQKAEVLIKKLGLILTLNTIPGTPENEKSPAIKPGFSRRFYWQVTQVADILLVTSIQPGLSLLCSVNSLFDRFC